MSIECEYTVVLSHDIDAITLRELPIVSKTFWGFPYRSSLTNFSRYRRGDLSLRQYVGSLMWAFAGPLAKLGVVMDPWYESFLDMIAIEREYGVRSTLFLISIPAFAGHQPDGSPAPLKRSGYYRLQDWSKYLLQLHAEGWELGVHGVDCHISPESARVELDAFSHTLGIQAPGLRMHWLYSSDSLRINARKAGFSYDSTLGWNDRIGFPEGRYRPFIDDASGLPIVPLNIQDGALLGEWRQGLTSGEAWQQISNLMDEAKRVGAVLTVLWHSSSFGPPRFWRDTYLRILDKALHDGAQIARAMDVVKELTSRNEGSTGFDNRGDRSGYIQELPG